MDELERRLLEVARALKRKKVTIGVPSDAKQPPTGKGTPPSLAVIAYQNEFGDDGLHIPFDNILFTLHFIATVAPAGRLAEDHGSGTYR